jgi:hypothetical protein
MLEDARHHAIGQLKSAAAGEAIDGGSLACADGIEEGAKLGTEGFFRGRGQLFKINFGLRRARFHANAHNVLPREIERNVFVLLKKAHFADTFGGDAAGGEIRHGASFELDARVGDVHFVGHHRDANCFQIRDGRIDERENYVEIVDHHVVHHVNIQAAGREDTEAVDFEKHGTRNDALYGRDSGIEALDVAHLKNAAMAPGRGDELVRFTERSGHGFFNQHIEITFEQATADPCVLFRGHCETDGLDTLRCKRLESRKDAGAKFSGDAGSAADIGVHDADKLSAFELAPHTDVVAAKLAGTNDGNADGFVVHGFF